MRFEGLGGNAQLKARLNASGELKHAYLISGGSGESRLALARTLAAFSVCEGSGERPCGVCAHCRKLAAGTHPDVSFVTRPEGKKEILVDQIRELRRDAYTLPNEAARRVYIIDDAADMNERAQNAFLKVLEEPPAYVLFLLCSASPDRLLQTVRSRVMTLGLEPEQGAEPVSGEAMACAQELLRHITARDEQALAAYMVSIEKTERARLVEIFRGLAELLGRMLREPGRELTSRQLSVTINAAECALRQCERGVGVGILTGAFAARCFAEND